MSRQYLFFCNNIHYFYSYVIQTGHTNAFWKKSYGLLLTFFSKKWFLSFIDLFNCMDEKQKTCKILANTYNEIQLWANRLSCTSCLHSNQFSNLIWFSKHMELEKSSHIIEIVTGQYLFKINLCVANKDLVAYKNKLKRLVV